MKVLVIGLDGATFNVLNPLMKEGKLPNIKKLVQNGVHGILRSSIPPATFPAWKCYSTGMKPPKLGGYYFLSFSEGKLRNPHLNVKEIWDYLSERNFRVCVINTPTTYPAKPVNGYMVSGYPILGENYTYPPEFKNTLSKFNYKTKPSFVPHTELTTKENVEKEVEEIRKIIESRFDLAEYMIDQEDFDFFQLTIFYCDAIQHFFWEDTHVLSGIWELIDKRIGDLLMRINKDTIVFIVSDHGFCSRKNGILYLNKWLEEKGYLKFKKKNYILLSLNLRPVISFLEKTKLIKIVRMVIPQTYRKNLPNVRGEISFDEDIIDWNESLAVMFGQGIYINRKKVDDYDRFLNRLREEIKNIQTPMGDTFFEDVGKPEDVYGIDEIPDGFPDLILLPKPGYFVSPAMASKIWNTSKLRGRESIHDMNGVFIAYGKDIKRGCKIQDAEIYDIAPTILHIFDIPIPRYMDGRVLKEIFREGSVFHKKEVRYLKEEKEFIRQKIRKLRVSGKI